MKPIVVVPTYNEIENLERIVGLIREQPGGFHILIVDDNSPDGTGRLADELSIRYPDEVHVVHRERKEGLGRLKRFSIGEISIVFRDRDLGRSKIDFPIILEAVWGVIRLRIAGR